MRDKLHLGCGKCYLPPETGWFNVDLFSNIKADAYFDVANLGFDRESFSLILCVHVLEHLHRNAIVAVLSHWRSLLKVGGILRLAVPNFSAVCEWYNKTGNLDDVMGLLYGRQDHPLNRHLVTFDANTLRRDLMRAGFETIRHWDWRTTEHAQFDDYSQARLPGFSDGPDTVWVSLNLEAVR